MSSPPEDRSSELRALFFESAAELLQTLNEAGLELEARPADEEVIRSVRRAVHTLKGDSAACGYHQLSELAHELEDVLNPQAGDLRGRLLAEVVLTAADVFESFLLACKLGVQLPSADPLRDQIKRLLAPTDSASQPPPLEHRVAAHFAWSEYEQLMISEAIHRGEAVFNVAMQVDPASSMRAAAFQLIRNVLHGAGSLLALHPEDNAAAANVDVVEAALATSLTEEALARRCRIPSIVADLRIERSAVADSPEHDLLGALLEAQAAAVTGEASDAAPRRADGPASAVNAVAESTIRVDASRVDSVMNLVGELIIGKSMLQRAVSEFDLRHSRDPIRAKLGDALAFQSRVLDELHKSVLKIRMVPVEQLFRRFPRVVRDLAKQCRKDVALSLDGQTTDLDKSILDTLAEPLTHLVRNAVDHGIESAEERLAAGKPARGTIQLIAYHQGTQVVIEVRDDGRGIDAAALRARAIEKGILSAEEAKRLTETESLNLVFEPGLTTAAAVTEVSGRGVGMDVVRTVLERLKGNVQVATQHGKGATFQLRVPLTLASIQTLLFRVAGRLFAIPLSSVLEITRIHEPQIHCVDQREVLHLRDHLLTLVRLERLERIHAVETPVSSKRKFVVVIGSSDKRFGLLVDSLVGEQELVIKALPGDLVASDLVSGASILGDGTVVMILNVAAVVSRLGRALPLGATA